MDICNGFERLKVVDLYNETSKLFGTEKLSLKFSVNVISLTNSSRWLINILFVIKDEINYKEDLEAKIEFHQNNYSMFLLNHQKQW